MGFLGKLFGKKDEEAAVELSSAVTQQPVYEEKLQTIDMSKHNENLGKVLIDMSKGSKIDMTKHTARVALAMDYQEVWIGCMIMDLYRKPFLVCCLLL